ncbi:MAG: hypothetical protein AAFU80_11170 [Pseudomonadota bacterium]
MGWVRAEAEAGPVAVGAAVGNLRELCLASGKRRIEPLHTATWVGGEVPEDLAPVERGFSDAFFCAQFGLSGVGSVPPHGLSANSHWTMRRQEAAEIELALNVISREAYRSERPLGNRIKILHEIGAVPRPEGWAGLADIRVSSTNLVLIEAKGAEMRLPFDPDFISETS